MKRILGDPDTTVGHAEILQMGLVPSWSTVPAKVKRTVNAQRETLPSDRSSHGVCSVD